MFLVFPKQICRVWRRSRTRTWRLPTTLATLEPTIHLPSVHPTNNIVTRSGPIVPESPGASSAILIPEGRMMYTEAIQWEPRNHHSRLFDCCFECFFFLPHLVVRLHSIGLLRDVVISVPGSLCRDHGSDTTTSNAMVHVPCKSILLLGSDQGQLRYHSFTHVKLKFQICLVPRSNDNNQARAFLFT
jgi:hypothetical protein